MKTSQKHKNDAISVNIWVQDMKSNSETNPVLLCKAQDSEPFSKCPSLKKEDFMLALQTPSQRESFVTFGNNIICMDDTHGTNSYDFNLITVLVVDEQNHHCSKKYQ